MTSGSRHIAIISSPTLGHLNPLQVLGTELVALGAQVTFVHVGGVRRSVTEPAVGFEALPEQRGASGRLDAYLAKLARPTGPFGLRRMIRATAAMTEALLDGAPDVLRGIGADAVIADAVEPAGPVIAQRLGIPHVVSVTGLPLLREESVPPPFTGWPYRPDASGRSRNRGGYAVSDWLMRPIARVVDDHRKQWRLEGAGEAPRVYVAQCPQGLDYPRSELPPEFRYGSPWRHAATEGLTLPDDGRPLVFCSLGTLQGARRRLFTIMASACARVGARAVIGHGGGLTAAEEAALPGDPLVRAFWPQELVLQRASAAVLHAGFNSVLDALAAGVPIVSLPIAFEQPATAARLERIGAGKTLSPRFLTVHALSAALGEVMHQQSYPGAARAIAREMAAAGGAAAAARAITSALSAP